MARGERQTIRKRNTNPIAMMAYTIFATNGDAGERKKELKKNQNNRQHLTAIMAEMAFTRLIWGDIYTCGVPTVSRIDKMIGLFCRISSL